MSEAVARVRLDAIAFDAGTQIREAIDQAVVADYAEAMTDGARFPPVVLFHDGNQHYLADGFHRFMAAQRLQWRHIDALVNPGTKEDALWFALGANREHGMRMSGADKRHAIVLAYKAWSDKGTSEIAKQIGCSDRWVRMIRSEVTSELPEKTPGKDGKNYPTSKPRQPERVTPDRAGKLDTTKAGIAERKEQMRQLAADGHISRQIASVVGMSEESCRNTLRESGIDVPADRVVGKAKRHDSNRIVAQMVSDAENLAADVKLIDFSSLDRSRLMEWLRSLNESRDKFGAFIRRLMKEQQKHGEAT
jgi:hypothetical protein